MIDLRDKDRQAIIDIAAATLPGNAVVWAYGSRVKGAAHDTSDLDLAIKTPAKSPLSLDQWDDFRTALQDSNIPILIQVFDLRQLPESFYPAIEAQHVEIWRGEDVE
ncbi:nucleotidyltransferase family protein [endosymbiont of Lamellibrachia barhami]|uniref:nucleotidyltransferase family protein n=1 Tax=endosymbiont of Lamellibrachia barhami TaxID=205975 RepID=UPI0015A89878|nr:nucleotidyltransferase domain-containing protein [endosymbiont of Lamellibrachia barhami]